MYTISFMEKPNLKEEENHLTLIIFSIAKVTIETQVDPPINKNKRGVILSSHSHSSDGSRF